MSELEQKIENIQHLIKVIRLLIKVIKLQDEDKGQAGEIIGVAEELMVLIECSNSSLRIAINE